MVKVNRLRNLLRKWRSALLTEDEVRTGFEEVLEKSVAYTEDFNSYRNELRMYNWDSLKAYQKCNTEAAQAIEQGTRPAFKQAILLINEGKKIRKELFLVIETVKELNKAKELLKSIERSIDSRWLKKMPSIVLLYRYLKEAEKLMKDQHFMEAKVLIQSCIQDINWAKAQENTSTTTLEDFENLVEIFQHTYQWSLLAKGPQLAIQGKVELLINELVENEQIKFAQRLVEDLRYISKDRISFYKILLTYQGSLSTAMEQDIKEALKNEGWIAGSNVLLTKKLTSVLEQV